MTVFYDNINDLPTVDYHGAIGQYLDFAILGNQGSDDNLVNVVTGESIAFVDKDGQANSLVFNHSDGSVSQSKNNTGGNPAVLTGMMSNVIPSRINDADLLKTSDFIILVDLACSGSNGKTGQLFSTIGGSSGDEINAYIGNWEGGAIKSYQAVNYKGLSKTHGVTKGRRIVALCYSADNKKLSTFENGTLSGEYNFTGEPSWQTGVSLSLGLGNGPNTRIYSQLVFVNPGAAFTSDEINQIINNPYSAFETYQDSLTEYCLSLSLSNEKLTVPFSGPYSGHKTLEDGSTIAISGTGTHTEDGTTAQKIVNLVATDANGKHVFDFDRTTGASVNSSTTSITATLINTSDANWQPVIQKYTFNVPADYASTHAALIAERNKGAHILNEIIVDGIDTTNINLDADPSITRALIRGKNEWNDASKKPVDGIKPNTGVAALVGGHYAGDSSRREQGYPIQFQHLLLESTDNNAVGNQYWRNVANVEFYRCDIVSLTSTGYAFNTNTGDATHTAKFKQCRFETKYMMISSSRIARFSLIDCYSPKTTWTDSIYADAVHADTNDSELYVNGLILNYIGNLSGYRNVFDTRGKVHIENVYSSSPNDTDFLKHVGDSADVYTANINDAIDMTSWFGSGGELTADARTAIGTGTGFNGSTILEWADASNVSPPSQIAKSLRVALQCAGAYQLSSSASLNASSLRAVQVIKSENLETFYFLESKAKKSIQHQSAENLDIENDSSLSLLSSEQNTYSGLTDLISQELLQFKNSLLLIGAERNEVEKLVELVNQGSIQFLNGRLIDTNSGEDLNLNQATQLANSEQNKLTSLDELNAIGAKQISNADNTEVNKHIEAKSNKAEQIVKVNSIAIDFGDHLYITSALQATNAIKSATEAIELMRLESANQHVYAKKTDIIEALSFITKKASQLQSSERVSVLDVRYFSSLNAYQTQLALEAESDLIKFDYVMPDLDLDGVVVVSLSQRVSSESFTNKFTVSKHKD